MINYTLKCVLFKGHCSNAQVLAETRSQRYAKIMLSKKANSTLGMVRRTIVTRDKDTILRLYKSLVRPQLEYCIQVWSPSIPGTGYGKTGESAKKSHKNDSRL